jgi:hypothetical protein
MEVFVTLVGVSFRGTEARHIVQDLTPNDGDQLSLEAEPTNPYDEHAVKVIHNPTGMHIGYLAKENNLEVFNALGENRSLKITIVSFENTIKPTLLIQDDDVPLTAEDMGEYPGDR